MVVYTYDPSSDEMKPMKTVECTCVMCTGASTYVSGTVVQRDLELLIPDAKTQVACPGYSDLEDPRETYDNPNKSWCATPHTKPVLEMVVHLNDTLKWSREEIADWLDTLDLDLSFGDPIESTANQPPPRRSGSSGPAIFMDVEGAVPPPDFYTKFIVAEPKSGKSLFEYSANDVALYTGTVKLADMMKKSNLAIALDKLTAAVDAVRYSTSGDKDRVKKPKNLPTRPGSQNYLKLKEKDRERSRRRTR